MSQNIFTRSQYLPLPKFLKNMNVDALHAAFLYLAEYALLDLNDGGECIFDYEEYDLGEILNDCVLRTAAEYMENKREDIEDLAMLQLFMLQTTIANHAELIRINLESDKGLPFTPVLRTTLSRVKNILRAMHRKQDAEELVTGIHEVLYVSGDVYKHIQAVDGDRLPELSQRAQSCLQIYTERNDKVVLDAEVTDLLVRTHCDITGEHLAKSGLVILFLYDMEIIA